MSRLREGLPLWLALERNLHRRYRSLYRDITSDVVIVGGGLTGALLAWTFANRGLRVVVLEAKRVGQGSTGANSGLLMHETDRDFGELTKWYGAAAARRIWQLTRQATRDFIKTLRQLEIDCDLAERHAVYFTLRSDFVSRLRAEHHRRRAAGLGGRWLDPTELQRMTGISGAAGVRSASNAQFNPYRACLGLLRAAEHEGAQIFEESAVARIKTVDGGIAAITRRGTVSARRVIVATGYATPEFTRLTGRFSLKHTYVLATRHISASKRAKLGHRQLMLWDTERPYHYARWAGQRLIIGGGDRPRLPEKQRARAFKDDTRQLRHYFDSLFPKLIDIEIEYAWEGLFANTSDGLPYIGPHRLYPHHLFALGYGGNGMAFAFLAGRLLLEWYNNTPSLDCQLFAFNRRRLSTRHG